MNKIIFAKNCANCFANFKKIVQKLRYTVYIEQKVQIHNCAKNYTKNCTKYWAIICQKNYAKNWENNCTKFLKNCGK